MKFTEYIMSYRGLKRDGTEGVVANIADYYDMYVAPKDERYAEHSLNGENLVVCPLHADVNPSMGLIRHKHIKGVQVFHCFGCHASGNIIRFHQRIESQFSHRELSEKDACMELAKMFDIPTEDFDELDDDDFEGNYIRTLKELDSMKNRYSVQDFSYACRDLRKEGVLQDLSRLNSECVKLIATEKQMYY